MKGPKSENLSVISTECISLFTSQLHQDVTKNHLKNSYKKTLPQSNAITGLNFISS